MSTGPKAGKGLPVDNGRGWRVAVACAVGLLVSAGPIIAYTYTVFFPQLMREFGWSRGSGSLGYSVFLLSMTLSLPLVGRLTDRYGARRIIGVSVLLFAIAVGLVSLVAGLGMFCAMLALAGAAGAGNGIVTYAGIVSRWFTGNRGLGLAVAMTGIGFGAFAWPFAAGILIQHFGWRGAYLALALCVVVLSLPMLLLVIRDAPSDAGPPPRGSSAPKSETEDRSIDRSTAIRTRVFCLLVTAIALMSISVNGMIVHLVTSLIDNGESAKFAAMAASVLGIATLAGRLFTGFLLDRYFAAYVGLAFFVLAGLGIILLGWAARGGGALSAAFMLGLGVGAETDLAPYLVARYFGLASFSELFGYVFAAYSLGGMIGPPAAGFMFDLTGSYRLTALVFAAALMAAGIIMASLPAYPMNGRVVAFQHE